jgi:hypothetical protein
MATTLHDTASAVVTLLNAGVTASAFTVSFAAAASYDTELLLEDADNALSVVVVPASLIVSPDSRVSVRYEAGIDVALRYRFTTTHQGSDGKVTTANVGIYMGVLEEVSQYLAKPANRALATKPTAGWIGNELRYPWIPEHLRNFRQYTGIFRATYRVAVEP